MLGRLIEAIAFASLLGAVAVVLAREYRSQDGTNNNQAHSTWCTAGQPFYYPVAPHYPYGDGYSMRNTSVLDGSPLPSARLVSNTLFGRGAIRKNSRQVSEMHTYWGLFITGDTVKSGIAGGSNGPAVPVAVPTGDPWFDSTSSGDQVLWFSRLGAVPGTGTGPTNPLRFSNQFTPLLDLDSLYHSAPETSGGDHGSASGGAERIPNLRTFQGGYLNLSALYRGPTVTPQQSLWRSVASDRLNNSPPMGLFTTVFMREHNRLAAQLAAANLDWSDETVFQEARRLVIAIYQKISSREYLAPIIGTPLPPYRGYNASVDPTVSQLFAFAFRYAHPEVNDVLARLDVHQNEVASGGNLPLRTCLYRLQSVLNAGNGIEPGLEAMTYGLAYTQQVRAPTPLSSSGVVLFGFAEVLCL